MSNTVYKSLPYVVECQAFRKFFEPIAAFNDKRVAEGYAVDCQKSNPSFVYRITTVKEA